MNYCTIQDAWGSNISNSFNKYMNNNNSNSINNNSINNNINNNSINNNIKKENNIEHFNEYNCNDFIAHLHKCKKCQAIIQNYNNNNNNNNNNNKLPIITYLYKLINENKDFIILVLIILFILLFINLVNNLTKN